MPGSAAAAAAWRGREEERLLLLEEDWGGELVGRAAEELRASSSEESTSKRLSRFTLDLVPSVWPLVVVDWESASCSALRGGASGRETSLSCGGDELGGDSE